MVLTHNLIFMLIFYKPVGDRHLWYCSFTHPGKQATTQCVCKGNTLEQPHNSKPTLKWVGCKASIKGCVCMYRERKRKRDYKHIKYKIYTYTFLNLPFWEDSILKRSSVSLSFVHRHDVNITTMISNHPSMYRCSADTGQLRAQGNTHRY